MNADKLRSDEIAHLPLESRSRRIARQPRGSASPAQLLQKGYVPEPPYRVDHWSGSDKESEGRVLRGWRRFGSFPPGAPGVGFYSIPRYRHGIISVLGFIPPHRREVIGSTEKALNIRGFIWREEIIDKLDWKHQITPDEVEAVFEGAPRFLRKERGKVEGEDLYNALGRTQSGRYLSVFFIYKRSRHALIVTARKMNRKERRYYGRK